MNHELFHNNTQCYKFFIPVFIFACFIGYMYILYLHIIMPDDDIVHDIIIIMRSCLAFIVTMVISLHRK